jgi:olefin beta-lactone synthetase
MLDNIASLLSLQATARPEQPAIIESRWGRQWVTTFAQLEQASARATALLWQSGLRPGETVLVFQPMSSELYIALAAIFRLGLVAMFLDPGQGRDHLEQCCAIQPPKALIASPKAHLLRLISPALRRIPYKFVIGPPLPGATSWKRAAHLPPHPTVLPCLPEMPALLTFTSGSTGQPKGAIRSHGFLIAQHQALADSLGLVAGEVDVATMPIVALANLASGVTCLIPEADLRYPGAIDPTPVVAQMREQSVNSIVASPALLERLAQYCLSRQISLPGLQKVFTGGAPVFPRLLAQLQQLAPQAAVVAVYGSTEAEPMAKIAYHQMSVEDREAMARGKGLLAGLPVEAVRLQIMKDQGEIPVGPYSQAQFAEVCCPRGEIGEIVVTGDHVLKGYLHAQGDVETKFKVEEAIWHRTGDAGYLDEMGRLWLLGRCSARIAEGHGLLYPFAVECAVSSLPEVRRSALVAYQGRRLLAVEFYPGMNQNPAQLKEILGWARLDEIRAYPKIPVDKRHNAKIDYPALFRLLAKS